MNDDQLQETFDALIRTPFDAIMNMVVSSIAPWVTPAWMEIHLAAVTEFVNRPTPEWEEIYRQHGWTYEELVYEAKRRQELNAGDE